MGVLSGVVLTPEEGGGGIFLTAKSCLLDAPFGGCYRITANVSRAQAVPQFVAGITARVLRRFEVNKKLVLLLRADCCWTRIVFHPTTVTPYNWQGPMASTQKCNQPTLRSAAQMAVQKDAEWWRY